MVVMVKTVQLREMGRGVEEVMFDGTCKNGWEKGMTNRCREIEQKGERFGFGWVEKFL